MSEISSLVLVDRITPLALGAALVQPYPAIAPISPNRVFHANGQVTTGTGSATISIEGSCDGGVTFVSLGTITLSLSTTPAGDGFASTAPWALIRANITALSGTNASINCYLGV